MKCLPSIILIAASFPLSLSSYSQRPQAMQLDLIQGAQELAIQRGTRLVHLQAGDVLKPKDKFTTGPTVSVRVVFPDGSQFWVGHSASVQVNTSGDEDGSSVQLVHLNAGSGRIIVPKSEGTARRLKFVVKTKAATMGVRGTDFVVSARDGGKNVELHTFEGTVSAAKSLSQLISRDAILVSGGYEIHAEEAKPIPQPQTFSVMEYQASLYKQQPAFSTFALTPIHSPAPVLEMPKSAPSAKPTGAPEANPQNLDQMKNNLDKMMRDREEMLDQIN